MAGDSKSDVRQRLCIAYAVAVAALPAFIALELWRPGSVTSVIDLLLVVIIFMLVGLFVGRLPEFHDLATLAPMLVALASLGVGAILFLCAGLAWGVAAFALTAALSWSIARSPATNG